MINFSRKLVVLLAVVGIISLIIGLIINHRNIGLYPDSAHYIDSAKNLVSGNGYSTALLSGSENEVIPQTHYPPLYSFLLAAVGAAGISFTLAAKILAVLLYLANCVLLLIILKDFLGNAMLPLIAGAVLIVFSPVFLSVHSLALTESLYIFLGTLLLFFLGKHRRSGNLLFLITAGILGGLAFLSRYIGFTLIGTGVVGLLFFRRPDNSEKKEVWKRIKEAVIFSVISALVFLPFFIRNLIVSEGLTDRGFNIHPVTPDHLYDLLVTISSWIVPGADRLTVVPGQTLILTVIGAAVYILLFYIGFKRTQLHDISSRNRIESNSENTKKIVFPSYFLLYIPVYIVSMIVSISFFDKATPFDDRTLSPVFISVIIIGIITVFSFLKHGDKRFGTLRSIVKVGSILILVLYVAAGSYWIVYAHNNGRGYNNTQWQSQEVSEAINFTLNLLEEDRSNKSKFPALIANDVGAMYFLGNTISYGLSDAEKNKNLIRELNRKEEIENMYILLFTFNPENPTVHGKESEWRGTIEKHYPELLPAKQIVDFGKAVLYRKKL